MGTMALHLRIAPFNPMKNRARARTRSCATGSQPLGRAAETTRWHLGNILRDAVQQTRRTAELMTGAKTNKRDPSAGSRSFRNFDQ